MTSIRYRFDIEKLVHALAYFAARGVSDMSSMKAMKLLYFADKAHLLRYGRPITGDQYYAFKFGPVPTVTYNLVRDFLGCEATDEPATVDMFDEYFEVRVDPKQPKYPQLAAKKQPDLDVFSDSEVEVLDQVISQYGALSATNLSNITHADATWAGPATARIHDGSSIEIPWEHFFAVAGEERMLRFAQAQQEDRDFTTSMSIDAEVASTML